MSESEDIEVIQERMWGKGWSLVRGVWLDSGVVLEIRRRGIKSEPSESVLAAWQDLERKVGAL